MGSRTDGIGEATLFVAGHEIRVFEVSRKRVRVSIIGPDIREAEAQIIMALDLRLRRGQWHGTWDVTGKQAGPFDSIKAVLALISEALAE